MKHFLIERTREQIKDCLNDDRNGVLILIDFKKRAPLDVIALEKDSKGEVIEMEYISILMKRHKCHRRVLELQTSFDDLSETENIVLFPKIA